VQTIRTKLTYANVMASLAVFLAMSGGAYAALKANTVGSKQIKPNSVKGIDVNEATFGQVPSAASAASATTAGTATTAAAATLADGVAPNAVGAAGIQDPARAINLPLTSFVNQDDQAVINFGVSNGTAPDFAPAVGGFGIQWDADTDGGGGDTGDTDDVISSFVLPEDYVSGGSVVFFVWKSGHSAPDEEIVCFTFTDSVLAGTEGATTIPATGLSTVVVTPGPVPALHAGALVQVRCFVHAESGPADGYNDAVDWLGVVYRYTAAQ
jgi:hypothetical protein